MRPLITTFRCGCLVCMRIILNYLNFTRIKPRTVFLSLYLFLRMTTEFLEAVDCIRNNDVERLQQLFLVHPNLKYSICPKSNHNLIGVAILHSANIDTIKALIHFKVNINKTIINIHNSSKEPLKAVPFVGACLPQIEAAYELIMAGAYYDFYDHESKLWLNCCRECNRELYKVVIQAIRDRSNLLGLFLEPVGLHLFDLRHQTFFAQIKIAAAAKRAYLMREQEEERISRAHQQILIARAMTERSLQRNEFSSISVQANETNPGTVTVQRPAHPRYYSFRRRS